MEAIGLSSHQTFRYFTTRPDVLGSISSVDNSGGQSHHAAAGAAVHKALASNPALTANLVSTGLKNVPKNSPYSGVVRPKAMLVVYPTVEQERVYTCGSTVRPRILQYKTQQAGSPQLRSLSPDENKLLHHHQRPSLRHQCFMQGIAPTLLHQRMIPPLQARAHEI